MALEPRDSKGIHQFVLSPPWRCHICDERWQARAKCRRLAQKGPDQMIDPAPPSNWYGALHGRALGWQTYFALVALGLLALSRLKIAGIRRCIRTDGPMQSFKRIETDGSVPKATSSPSIQEVAITVEV